jgi:hypothetical protein
MIYVDISAKSFDATLHSLLTLCETWREKGARAGLITIR